MRRGVRTVQTHTHTADLSVSIAHPPIVSQLLTLEAPELSLDLFFAIFTHSLRQGYPFLWF